MQKYFFVFISLIFVSTSLSALLFGKIQFYGSLSVNPQQITPTNLENRGEPDPLKQNPLKREGGGCSGLNSLNSDCLNIKVTKKPEEMPAQKKESKSTPKITIKSEPKEH